MDDLNKNELMLIDKIVGALGMRSFQKLLWDKVEQAFRFTFRNTQINYGFTHATPDPLALKYLEDRTFILSDKTRDRLTGNMRWELLEGIRNTESISEIKKRLDKVFTGMHDYEIERIARTETLNAMNAGRLEAYEASEVTHYKMWRAAINNKRTAADSRRLHGQIQELGDPFVDPKTGEGVMHPPNRPNCRCAMIPLRKLPENVVYKNGQMYVADEMVGKIEIDITSLQKTEKRIWVKPTSKRKGHYRKIKGAKNVEPKVTKPEVPPDWNIMKPIIDMNHIMSLGGQGSDVGFTKVDPEVGTMTWQNAGNHAPVDYRMDGRTIIRVDDNSQITIPEKSINEAAGYLRQKWPKYFADLDDDWGSDWGAHNPEFKRHFKDFKADEGKYTERMKKLDNFTPEYKKITGEGKGKYADSMGLQTCTNSIGVTTSGIAYLWYSGNPDSTSLIGEAVNEVVVGRYNKDNVVQQQIPMLIEASKKVNKSHGEDVIYRGETNIRSAKSLLHLLNRTGTADLADKLFSCTENEKLGKWYASVHNQESARGVASKTHIMLKIPREKFEENVIMDYRLMGDVATPEQEVSIVGNGISLTGDNVMVHATTPKRKTKKWMTFTQFKDEGGETQNLIDQMVGEK